MHFDLQQAVAGTVLAPPALDVKAEAPRLVAAHFRGGELCEQIADDRKGAGVGDGVASRGAADRRLIDHNHLVDLIDAEQLLVFAGTFLGTMEVTEEGAAQHVVGERALAGTGNAGDAGEQTERDFDVHVLEIVFRRPFDFKKTVGGFGPFFRYFDLDFAPHVLRGQRVFGFQQLFRSARKNNFAAVDARAGTEVDHVVGLADGLFVVFDDDDRITEIAQLFKRGEQAVVITLMQTDARFIEYVEHAGQARADLRGQPDALRFAAGERAAFAVERKVVEPDIDHKRNPRADFF